MFPECPICLGRLSKSIGYPGPVGARNRLAFRSIGLCERCGGGTALPRPNQERLDQFYSSGTYWDATAGYSQLAHASSQANIRLNACLPYLRKNVPTSVADIGAGHGFIGQELARSSLDIARYDCVEPDETAGAHIGTHNLPFPVNVVRTTDRLDARFNLVFLNQVIEHVADPLVFLEQVISHADPGSIVYVETPNSDYNFKSDVFPHTLFYSTEALEFLGRRLRVDTLLCEKFGLWPSSRKTPRGLMQRLASRAFVASNSVWLKHASGTLDRFIWRYDSVGLDACVWLRWIFRIPKRHNP